MASSVGDLVANLIANTTKWTQGLNKARKEMSAFESHVTSQIAGITAGFAAFASIDFLKGFAFDAIREAEAAGSASAKLQSVLETTGGAAGVTTQEIEKLATDLQRLTTIEDDAAVNAAALLAAFKNIKGDQFRQALRLAADLSAFRGVDINQAATLVGRALAEPEKGMERLARVGIVLTDSQKEVVKHFRELGDTVGAQNALLKAFDETFGGVAERTADSSVKIARAFEELKEAAGRQLLPYVDLTANQVIPQIFGFNDALDESSSVVSRFARGFGILSEAWFPIIPLHEAIKSLNEDLSRTDATVKNMANVPLPEIINEEDQKEAEKFQKAMQSITDEIGLMTGELSKFDVAVRKLQENGFGAEQAAELARKQLELEARRAEMRQQADAARAADVEASSFEHAAEAIRRAVESPLEEFDRIVGEAHDLMQRGFLDPATFEEFRLKQQQRLDELTRPDQQNAIQESIREAIDTSVGAAMKGSVEAVSSILRAQTGSDPANQLIDGQDEANILLADILATLRSGGTGPQLAIGSLA